MLTNNLNTVSDFKTILNSSRSKGKLHTKPNWTAYNRKNLSSIPSKIENIIIDVKTESINKAFLSNTRRFSKRSEGVKFNYPGPGSYHKNVSDNKVYSAKGYGVGFVSKKPRFDEYSDYVKMYEPGPSDYTITLNNIREKVKDILQKNKQNKTENCCLKEDFIGPGPGYYDVTKHEEKDKNYKTNNFFFKSTSTRFKYQREKFDKKNINNKNINDNITTENIGNNENIPFIQNIQNITATSEFYNSTNNTFFKDKFPIKGKGREEMVSGNNTNYNTFYTDNSKTKNSTFYPQITSYNNTLFGNFRKTEYKSENDVNNTKYNINNKANQNIKNNTSNNDNLEESKVNGVIKNDYIFYENNMNVKHDVNKKIINTPKQIKVSSNKILNNNNEEKYESHYNANLDLNNAKESALVRNNNTTSFFFKPKNVQIKNPLIEIGINVNENVNKVTPGPGSYNIGKEILEEKEYKYQPYLEFLKYQREASKQKIKPKPKKRKHRNKNDYYQTFTEFNVEKVKNKKSSAFLSKSPKLTKLQNDIPGPCYYSPQDKMNRTSFNSLVGKKWLNG